VWLSSLCAWFLGGFLSLSGDGSKQNVFFFLGYLKNE